MSKHSIELTGEQAQVLSAGLSGELAKLREQGALLAWAPWWLKKKFDDLAALKGQLDQLSK